MKKLRNHLIGVDHGDPVLFSDFETEGEMWTGRGPRERRRRRIKFSESFRSPPVVQVSVSMWDIDGSSMMRADVQAETVTADGFDMVFRTWGDTRVARIRVGWMAVGELKQRDEWDVD